jgi:hypothetical protein
MPEPAHLWTDFNEAHVPDSTARLGDIGCQTARWLQGTFGCLHPVYYKDSDAGRYLMQQPLRNYRHQHPLRPFPRTHKAIVLTLAAAYRASRLTLFGPNQASTPSLSAEER